MEAPPSHEKEAWKIVSGPGTLEEKSQRLQELQELYPDDKTIADWGSALEDEYELELMRAGVEGKEPAPEAPEVPSEGQADSEPIDTTGSRLTRPPPEPARGAEAARVLKSLGVKGILVRAAELGYITQVTCRMPECFCPEELGGARYFEPVTAELSDWMPTLEHFPISKREGGRESVDNAVLAHRLCNRIDYSITAGRSYKRDLERVRKARDAAAGNSASSASTALIRGLRRSGFEPQLTQALASVFRADTAMASEFVRLILRARQEAELAAAVPPELACATEEVIEAGRVDLRFSGEDWDLIVELKIHAGYGREWLERYQKSLLPVTYAHVVAVTRDVTLGEPPPREDPYPSWLGAVRWRELRRDLLVLRPRDSALAAQWPLFLEVLETEGSMGFTKPNPTLFDAFAASADVMRHMTDFLKAIERPLLHELIAALGGGSAAPFWKPGRFSSSPGRLDIPFQVPAGGPGGIRVGLVGSVPPTTFFVQPSPGQRWLTHFDSLSAEAKAAVTQLRDGSFNARGLRAKFPLVAELLTDEKFEEQVLKWARERFDEIVASNLLDHPLPRGKQSDPVQSDSLESDDVELG